MAFGSAFHTLVIEPDLFDKNYFVLPEKVLLKNVGRELYDAYKKVEKEAESCKDKVVLARDDFDCLLAMRDAIYRNGDAKGLIEGAVYEQSYFWKDKATDLMLKCRPDILHENMIVDLKTVNSASEKVMKYEVFDYGYDLQAAMMRDGIFETTGKRIDNFILLCVEKKYPYCIGIYILDEEVINRAETRYKDLLVELKKCQETNEWPSYPIATIGLPKWLT
jgi:exodeoxyribonuclease VIII